MSIRDRLKSVLLAMHISTAEKRIHDFFLAEFEAVHKEIEALKLKMEALTSATSDKLQALSSAAVEPTPATEVQPAPILSADEQAAAKALEDAGKSADEPGEVESDGKGT